MREVRAAQRRFVDRAAEDTIVSVERAFAIIEMLADEADGLSLADIARQFGVNKAIAVKLLSTLESLGLIWRDEIAQRYQLTYRISNLGLRQLQQSRLLDQCAPVLKALAEDTGELVRLAVVERGERITWVYAIAGAKRSVQIDPNYSLEISLNTHAIAKAWLSTLPLPRALAIIKARGLESRTASSKTGLAQLEADLTDATQRGFATNFEESEPGVVAIAAPIIVSNLQSEAECVGAVSLAAPTNRMSAADIEGCAPMLQDTVARLARIWPLDHRTLRPLLRRL